MKRRIGTLLLCLIVVLLFAGCADEEVTETYTVTRAYINQEYVETGSEEQGIVVLLTSSVDLNCTEKDKYKAVIESLREEYMPADAGKLKLNTAVDENIKFNDIYLKDSTVYVDFKSEGLNGGSLQESMLITQIVETLTDSFSEVKDVRLLIDGKESETLMGHIDISQPFVEGVLGNGANETDDPESFI